MSVLVVVPFDNLKEQWSKELDERGLGFNTDVRVMMGASKKEWSCDLLIIDEAHKINSEVLSNVLTNTKFKLILGLTATFERLDGRHEILAKYANNNVSDPLSKLLISMDGCSVINLESFSNSLTFVGTDMLTFLSEFAAMSIPFFIIPIIIFLSASTGA